MEKKNLSKERKNLINAGLEALASLESAIQVSDRIGEKKASENMKELCDLVEQMMYCPEEEAEKKLNKIMDEMEDRCNLLIGQTLTAQYNLKVKNND